MENYKVSDFGGYGCIELTAGNTFIGQVTYDGDIIRLVMVNENYRRQGYGSKLLRRAEEQIKTNGYKIAFLIPVPLDKENLSQLQQFYFKNGWNYLPQYIQWFCPDPRLRKLL